MHCKKNSHTFSQTSVYELLMSVNQTRTKLTFNRSVKLPADSTDMRYSAYSNFYPKIYRYIVWVISRRIRPQLQ